MCPDPRILPGRSDIAAGEVFIRSWCGRNKPADPACTSCTRRLRDSSQRASRAENVIDNQSVGACEFLLDTELTIEVVRTAGITTLGLGSELSPSFYTDLSKATSCAHRRCETLTEAEHGAVMPGYYDDNISSRQRGMSGDHFVEPLHKPPPRSLDCARFLLPIFAPAHHTRRRRVGPLVRLGALCVDLVPIQG